MFDAPADTWYLSLGVATASALAFGLAASFPTTAPPDAAAATATIDAVAASEHESTGEHPLDASAVKLGSTRLSLRNAGGVSHGVIAEGPVTPVRPGTNLARVLAGTPPRERFESPAAFERAAAAARTRPASWRGTDGRLVVRRIDWEGVDVTLVGA